MRRLDFSYEMQLRFAQPVCRHAFQLRCLPPERAGQHIERVSCMVSPDTNLSVGTDGFGNPICYGLLEEAHDRFSVRVDGTAQLTPAIMTGDALQAAIYRPQTPFTRPGEHIRRLYAQAAPVGAPMDRALGLMRLVRAQIAYVPASTTVATTAEQAAAQSCGVCQDHTQILLSLLRLAGVPCRYVSGLLLGEGRTHAWAEAFIDGRWIGLDATNGTVVQDTHIALAVGRDHEDCQLNRGVMLGSGGQTQTVQVCVTEHRDTE